MFRLFVFLFVFLFLYLVVPENQFITSHVAQVLNVEPHHAAHKIQMGLFVIFFASLIVWAITLTIRSMKLKHSKF